LYGAKGLKSVAIGFIMKHAFKYLAKLVRGAKGIPFVGTVANQLDRAGDKISEGLYKLTLAFNNGLVMPSGQLSLTQAISASETTQRLLAEAEAAIGEKTVDILHDYRFDAGIFDTADHVIQDYVYLSALEWQCRGRQEDAVGYARSHDFPVGRFNQAASDATNVLNHMVVANQVANDVGNFADTIREIASTAALIASAVVIVGAIVGAFVTGGATLLIAIAGLGGLVLTYGSLVATTSAVIESAGTAVHVNAILPYCYVNPSVDAAFGPGLRSTPVFLASGAEGGTLGARGSDYGDGSPSTIVQDYYLRLRGMVVSGDPAWASRGMDSLAYYEDLARREEEQTIADFMASADSARFVIHEYDAMISAYMTRAAAREIFSASLEISSLAYSAGLTNPYVLSNAVAALDSTIANFEKSTVLRSGVYDSLQVHAIPIPAAVGIGTIHSQILSTTHAMARLKVQVVNYGSYPAEGVKVFPSLSPDRGRVVGDSLYTVTLQGRDTIEVEFQFVSNHPMLSGVILTRASSPGANYRTLPGRSFLVDLTESSPPTQGTLNSRSVYAYPNPFDPDKEAVTFRFRLAKPGNVSVKVYDASNTLVAAVASNLAVEAGKEIGVKWNGRSGNNKIVANGTYIYVIESSSGERGTGKVAVLR